MDDDNAKASFGTWVRTRRRQLDLTQAELGKRASCSEATIRKIEANERKPSEQLARLLVSALSIPPSEAQRFLKSARGQWVEGGAVAGVEGRASRSNLPAWLTSTIDRIQDQAAVIALLKAAVTRLVTIIGPPGIGKTRLSIHCGVALQDDFPDGVWFVDLSEVHNPAFFVTTVARALPEVDLPPSPDLAQLILGLKDRRILLILDNFEQIAGEGALDVARMLKACPSVKLLVTSRTPLNIYGENEYPLPSLTIPPGSGYQDATELLRYESVQLLLARIRLHQPYFAITVENSRAIYEICRILDGIPLAIEMAAAVVRQKTLGEMVELLHGRDWIRKIENHARDLPERQRTLENAIEWSFNLLDGDKPALYARLGVFSGWFDAEGAGAVLGTNTADAITRLNGLTEHSLLVRGSMDGQTCWRMLEIIHDHAYSKMAHPEMVERLRAQYFIDKIDRLRQNTLLPAQEVYIANQLPNMHSALNWAINVEQTALALELVFQLEGYWYSLGYLKEGLDFCRQVYGLIDGVGAGDQRRFLQISSDLAWQQHDFDTAQIYMQKQVALDKAIQATGDYPAHLNRLGRIFIEQGKLDEAEAALLEAFEAAPANDPALNPGIPLAQLGEVALFRGELEKAKTLCEQALSFLEPDELIFLAMARTNLAEIALANGDLNQARAWMSTAFGPAQTHLRRLIVFLNTLAGYLALSPSGHVERAARFYGAIDRLCERAGLPLGGFYQAINQQRQQRARQAVSESDWQRAYNEGQAWGKEDAIKNAEQALIRMPAT